MLVTCVLAVAVIAIGGWLGNLHSLPSDPPPLRQNFPVPNGYDTLRAAYKLYVPMPIPAVDEIEETRSDIVVSGHLVPRQYSAAAREAWLQRNAATLALLRDGLGQQYLQPATMWGPSGNPRGLARLLVVEAHARALHSDWQGAADSGLDIVALAGKIPSGSALMGQLVGAAIEQLGLPVVWDAVPHLSSSQTQHVLVRLKAIEADRVPLRQTFAEEKASWRHNLLMLLRADIQSQTQIAFDSSSIWAQLRWKFADYRLIMADEDAYWDKAIATADKPYGSREIPFAPQQSLADPLAYIGYSLGPNSYFVGAENETRVRLLISALALQVYKGKHGQYPDTLSQLVPATLRKILIDPLGVGDPLVYRRHGTGYLLYSIGPDGHDDGGRPIDHPGHKNNAHYVRIDDKGDVVSGINQ